MPAPTTTNLTVGSIFDLLAPMPAARREGDEGVGFGELLTPPPAVTPPQSHAAAYERANQPASDPPVANSESVADADEGEPSAPSASDTSADDQSASGAASTEDASAEAAAAEGDEPIQEAENDSEATSTDESAKLLAESLAGILPIVQAQPAVAGKAPEGTDEVAAAHVASLGDGDVAAQKGPLSVAAVPTKQRARRAAVTEATSHEQSVTVTPSEIVVQQATGVLPEGLQEAEGKSGGAAVLGGLETAEAASTDAKAEQQVEIQAADPVLPPLSEAAEHREGNERERHQSAEFLAEQTVDVREQAGSATAAPEASRGADATTAVVASATAPIVSPRTAAEGRAPAPLTPQVGSTGQRATVEGLAQRAEGAGRRGPVEIDTVRLLTRVTRAFQSAQQRDGEIRLRLSPPELGALRLTIQVQDGLLVARMETETPAARTAIMDNLPALRERLAEQGVRIERFDVDLMQRQFGGMPDRPQDQERQAQGAFRNAEPTRPRPSGSVPPARGPHGIVDASGRLNVII